MSDSTNDSKFISDRDPGDESDCHTDFVSLPHPERSDGWESRSVGMKTVMRARAPFPSGF